MRASGKALLVGDAKLLVRGATYGPFGAEDREFPAPDRVTADLALMEANGVNAIRTYTIPPGWLLDLAAERGIRVMVGIPWEGHVAFLDERLQRSIERRLRDGVRRCAGHPAVLCYAVGNEIPASIVRWHGSRRTERFLRALCDATREEDPGGLVTYANYPSTEYLHLPFLDVVTFNVFLEDEERFGRYLDRLQNLAGDRPLLLGETGLDSTHNGPEGQADALRWQLRGAFEAGCAGAFAFAWTDEWHRGGGPVAGWSFGLVDRDREPKPALAAVREVFADAPLAAPGHAPLVTVVVCTYNGARTLPACLDGIARLDYPRYEVVVVDDGSVDGSGDLARELGARVISTPNHGLAHARNVGHSAARGEIVAYLDDDARPDPDWLRHVTAALADDDVAAVGGPNVLPPDQGGVAACVAHAPGGPVHVLLSDREAEHVPGCNMAIRTAALDAVGGFDPRFRIAGDDVDICWRLQQAGWRIAFSPGAFVYHRRRATVRAYLRQQHEYGRAEAQLERKWPERYNEGGHLTWSGRVYAGDALRRGWRRSRIYYGRWGSSLFQPVQHRPPGMLTTLTATPESSLAIVALAGISALGVLWPPLIVSLPALLLVLAAVAPDAALAARRALRTDCGTARRHRVRFALLIAALHLLQPPVRLAGRLRSGLAPWRRRSPARFALPRPRLRVCWCEGWMAPEHRIRRIEDALRARGGSVFSGGPCDRWDLEIRGGLLGGVRLRTAVEEHGAGRQLVRVRTWPVVSRAGVGLLAVLLALAAAAAADGGAVAAAVLAGATVPAVAAGLADCGTAAGLARDALAAVPPEPQPLAQDLVAGRPPVDVAGGGL